jgi:hypothetical protein
LIIYLFAMSSYLHGHSAQKSSTGSNYNSPESQNANNIESTQSDQLTGKYVDDQSKNSEPMPPNPSKWNVAVNGEGDKIPWFPNLPPLPRKPIPTKASNAKPNVLEQDVAQESQRMAVQRQMFKLPSRKGRLDDIDIKER